MCTGLFVVALGMFVSPVKTQEEARGGGANYSVVVPNEVINSYGGGGNGRRHADQGETSIIYTNEATSGNYANYNIPNAVGYSRVDGSGKMDRVILGNTGMVGQGSVVTFPN